MSCKRDRKIVAATKLQFLIIIFSQNKMFCCAINRSGQSNKTKVTKLISIDISILGLYTVDGQTDRLDGYGVCLIFVF